MFKIINKIILKLKFLFPIFLLVVLSLFLTNKTYAANLSLSPSSSTVSVGNIVSVRAYVNTQNKYINNAEAVIQFPTDMVDVVSIAKTSSIFSLWVEEPSFSNNTGKITFNGGVPNPGFNGQSGYIATITFKAKKQGTASIIFTDGAVRENDGLGTDILVSKNGSVIQITTPKEVIVPEKTKENDIGLKPFVPSIRFEGIQGIVKLSDEKIFSSIDYYTIQLDDNAGFKVKKDQLINYEYNLPILNAGNHTATIITFDKLGKYTENILTFTSPLISVPVLSLSSKEIIVNESVNILGKTDYSNKQVNVILEQDGKEIGRYSQLTGSDGSFLVTTDNLNTKGIISIYAKTLLSEKIVSGPSEKVYLKVNEKEVVRITLAILYRLIALLIILIILLIILFLLYLGWHKYFGLRKKFENESKQAALEIHNNMVLLKEDLKRQLESLEIVKVDRALNEREEAIFNEIKKNIDSVDIFIEQKLKKLI